MAGVNNGAFTVSPFSLDCRASLDGDDLGARGGGIGRTIASHAIGSDILDRSVVAGNPDGVSISCKRKSSSESDTYQEKG